MINYIKGDATDPVKKPAIIVHVCNDIGKWGKGFVMALSKKWPDLRKWYIKWWENAHFDCQKSILGEVQILQAEENILVANIVAQQGIYPKNGIQPIRYDSLTKCLSYVREKTDTNYSIHMPRIGCGLAGGKWNMVEQIIKDTLKDFDVYVYDYD